MEINEKQKSSHISTNGLSNIKERGSVVTFKFK